MALHQQGAGAKAEAIYRRLLRDRPGEPGVASMLALLLLQAGRLDEALQVLDGAIRRAPRAAELHSSRGLILARLGRLDAAEQAYRTAIALQPGLADAHVNLGAALQRLGRTEEALDSYARALQLKPANPQAYNNIANALSSAGRLREAAEAYGRALALRPAYVEARAGRAAVLAELDRLELAEQDYRALRQAAPAEPRFALRLADLLADTDRYDEARRLYEEVLARAPETADAHFGLARIAAVHGDFAAAAAGYARAAAIDPACVSALGWLAEYAEAPDEATAARLAAVADDPGAPLRQRSLARYGLSRLRAKAKDYDDAFAHLAEANELDRRDLQRRGHVFDAAANAALVDRLVATFDEAFFRRASGWGDPTERPIFIVGMPRSGTTLCEQILASHPLVHGGGERRDIVQIVRRLPELLPPGGQAGLADPYPECIARLTAASAARIAREYRQLTDAVAPAAARLTDKQPLNFRHLALIAALLPGARVIHCRRDPVDTCFSCYWQAFNAPMPWATRQEDLAAFHAGYRRLMAHWQRVLPRPVLEFTYEDVVADLEGAVRRLLDFCGLPWEPRCLDFQDTVRAVATASSLQVRQALKPRTGQWRPYAAHLAPLLRGLAEAEPDRPAG